jgi:hypothetical protein
MCAKPDSLLVTVHAEEGIDLDDYFGEDEENLYDDDDEQDDKDEGDEDNEMRRVPDPAVTSVSTLFVGTRIYAIVPSK